MRFVAIGSASSSERLAMSPGYRGCINSSNIELLRSAQTLDGFKEVDIILVELSPESIHTLQTILGTIRQLPIAYYEYVNDTVLLNTELINTYQSIAGNYFKVHTQTQGQIGYLDGSAIVLNSLKHIHDNGLKSVAALEVGSWTGCSSYFLANAITALNTKNSILYCLDNWRGNEYWNYDVATHIDIFANFRGYMTCFGVYDNIVPIVTDSKRGFEVLQDSYFDIIFVDGDHRYEGAYNDIYQAIKKIKPGGLLMGHDGAGYAAQLPEQFLIENLNKDCAFYEGVQYSCGVLKALDDFFGTNYFVFNGSSTWYKVISEEEKDKLLRKFIRAK